MSSAINPIDGRYRVVTTLGEGSMGVVYEVQDAKDGRPYAVKVVNPALSALPDAAARLRREAKALTLLRHPSIVEVYQEGSTPDGALFLVMERLQGVSLKQILEAGAVE